MRILHLLGDRKLPRYLDSGGTSGVVRAALEIARAQVSSGHEVTVATIGREAWRAEWEGVQLVELAAAPWAHLKVGSKPLDFRLHLPYVVYARRRTFDLTHGHLYNYLPYLGIRLRVAHFHSDPFYRGSNNQGHDLKPADFECIGRNSHAQVAVSQFVAGVLRLGFNGMANVHVVYNGVDSARFHPERSREAGLHLRRQWGVREGEVVFLFSGAVIAEKGAIHLARAFARLKDQTPGVHLAVAGGRQLWGGILTRNDLAGDYESQVIRSLREPIEAGRVHLLGNVAASAMPTVYAASNVVVVPSVWREAFGLAALEGMASGRPVIASSTGGLLETVNERNGIHVPPGDEIALAEAMGRLAEDANLRKKLGEIGRQDALGFTWAAAAEKLDAIYSGISTKKLRR